MRWLAGGAVALLIIWTAYLVSPYWALVDLAAAIEARSPDRIVERVNFRAIRAALAKQIVAAGAASGAVTSALGSPDSNLAAGSIAVAAEPLLERVVTPEGVAALLRDLDPDSTDGMDRAARLRPDAEGLQTALNLVRRSRWRGFRNVYFTLDAGPARPQGARIQLRLSRMKWRLVGIDLTPEARQRLVDDLVRLHRERTKR
jgi:hypothetical protein